MVSIGTALLYQKKKKNTGLEDLDHFIVQIKKSSVPNLLKLTDTLLLDKEYLRSFLTILLLKIRSYFIQEPLFHYSICIKNILQAQHLLSRNVNARLVIDALLLSLQEHLQLVENYAATEENTC